MLLEFKATYQSNLPLTKMQPHVLLCGLLHGVPQQATQQDMRIKYTQFLLSLAIHPAISVRVKGYIIV